MERPEYHMDATIKAGAKKDATVYLITARAQLLFAIQTLRHSGNRKLANVLQDHYDELHETMVTEGLCKITRLQNYHVVSIDDDGNRLEMHVQLTHETQNDEDQ